MVPEQRTSIERIRRRAEELLKREDRSWEESAEHAALLSEIADGTHKIEDISEERLQSYVDAYGMEPLIEAAVVAEARANARAEATRLAALAERGEAAPVGREEAAAAESEKKRASGNVRLFPGAAAQRAAPPAPPMWGRGRQLAGPLALAASIAGIAVALVFVARYWLASPSQSHGVAIGNPGTIPGPIATGPSAGPLQTSPALTLRWPGQFPFHASRGRATALPPLPRQLPDFTEEAGASLGGAASTPAETGYLSWRLSTVIIRTESGWGSGVFIAADGWLISSYRVVESAVQQAALAGERARVKVVTGRAVDGRIERQPPVSATVFRVDPQHDLALLKLDTLPGGRRVEFRRLATSGRVRDGQLCYVIGSEEDHAAWGIGEGNVRRQFDYARTKGPAGGDRRRASVIVTDAMVAPGYEGGPLLNEAGELLGITTPAASIGEAWHVALRQLRRLVETRPSAPEAAPFDAWTAGLPQSRALQPELVDGDGDGRIDSLRIGFVRDSGSSSGLSSGRSSLSQPAALAVFIDFEQRTSNAAKADQRVTSIQPRGLWGLAEGEIGGFGFDIFLIAREDGVIAAGYTNSTGAVDEIRTGEIGKTAATLIWRSDAAGLWHSTAPSVPTVLFEPDRVAAGNMRRIPTIAKEIVGIAGPGGDLR